MGLEHFLSAFNAGAATFSSGSSSRWTWAGGISTDSRLERTHSVTPILFQVWNETALPDLGDFTGLSTLFQDNAISLVQAPLHT